MINLSVCSVCDGAIDSLDAVVCKYCGNTICPSCVADIIDGKEMCLDCSKDAVIEGTQKASKEE